MSELFLQRRTAVIQLFAKYPHPGTVKTRLISELGLSETTRLYIELLERQLQTVCSMPSGVAIELWGTEESNAEYYRYCQQCWPSISYRRQIDGNLGERMDHALNDSLHHYGAVLQTGTDCPALSREHLSDVLDQLNEGYDVVFIPAEDGGYVLAGYCCSRPGMFDDIDWGTEKVLGQCRRQLESLGLKVKSLPSLWDVDRPEDLSRYQKLLG